MSDQTDPEPAAGGDPGPPPASNVHDQELAELAELHGSMIDECVRVARLTLGEQEAAEAAAVRAFVVAHRRWYAGDDRVALVRRSLTRELQQADRVPREPTGEPLLAAFAALPVDQRIAAAWGCAADLRGDTLAAALGTDAGEAEARRSAGAAGVASSLSPGTDVDARCRAVPGPVDADETLLDVLRGVTTQVHVREQPRWVLVAVVLGILLIAGAIVFGIDWSDEGEVRISGDAPAGVATTVPDTTEPG